MPSQRLSDGRLAFVASNIPPTGAKRFFSPRDQGYVFRHPVHPPTYKVENDHVAIILNEKTGAIDSLRWKPGGVELVARTGGVGLHQYLYVRGRDPQNAQGLSNVKVTLKDKGPLIASLLVEGEAPGARRYTSEIRLTAGVPRVDIITTIDKLPVREKEGVHIAFPFAVPGGIVRYDVANAIVRAEADQLPGACKNFSSVQSWVDISNADFGVTVATPDAPLIEIGGINAELPWMTKLAPTQTFYSYLMNNYWHTNYKADQEGPVTFRYSILPHGPFRPEEAARFGREQREPLIAVAADNADPVLEPLFRIEPTSVLAHSTKPLERGKAFLIYLYNPTASAQKVGLAWRGNARIALHRSDASGAALARLSDGFTLSAHASAYVRVNLATAPQ